MLDNYFQNTLTGDKIGSLLLEKLGEALWSEQALVEMLPAFAKASFSMELTSTFDLYAAQTEEHIARLDKIFTKIGLAPQLRATELSTLLVSAGKVIDGLEKQSPERDIALIKAAKRITSYQIAFYEWLGNIAQSNDSQEIKDLIQNIVHQEQERLHILLRLEASFKSVNAGT